jgi:trans-aconitate 2-methyltransferase
MREVAHERPWREQLSERARLRDVLPAPAVYYDALSPICSHFQIWHTVYYHVLESSAGVVEWVKGTGLRPFLDLLESAEAKQFLAEYSARVAAAYLPQADGKVIFRFPRIFIVAVK